MTHSTNTTGPDSVVVSLEWAKKLKEAGWPQEYDDNIFYWRSPAPIHGRPEWSLAECTDTHAKENYAAPTAEELLRKLPPALELEGRYCTIDCTKEIHISGGVDKGQWFVGYEDCVDYFDYRSEDTIANAAAALWIHLKQNNLLPSA